jgi:biotin carboxyl carrier protein
MNEYVITINNKKKTVAVSNNSEVILDGKTYHYEVIELGENDFALKINNRFYEISADKIGSDQYSLFINGKVLEAVVRTSLQEKASALIDQAADKKHRMVIKAPMPGMILKIKKNVGEMVQKGESIIILEAMKMENDIKSPFSGLIKEINVRENNPVEKGAVLFSIE